MQDFSLFLYMVMANTDKKKTVFHGLHHKSHCIAAINCTKIKLKLQLVYTHDFEVATSAPKKLLRQISLV